MPSSRRRASNILKKTKFIFDYNYEIEGDIRKPKLKAYVINQSRPGKIYIKFINAQTSSGDIIERVEVEPNDVNFTININYNTSTGNLLYITTIVDFESYKYSREVIQMVEEEKENCYFIEGIYLCDIQFEYTEDNPKILYDKKDKTVERQTVIEESIVNKDIFNFI